MHNPKGFLPIAAIIIIAVLALGAAGAAWLYSQKTDEEQNSNANTNTATNQVVSFSSCSQACAEYGYAKGVCQNEGSSLDSLQFQEANKGSHVSTIAGKSVNVANCDFNAIGSWESCYCLKSETDELVVPSTNSNTNVNTNTASNTNSACPTWPTYTDPEYGWTMDYPCDWTYERIYEASGDEVLFDYPIRYTIFKSPTNNYRLLVGIMQTGDEGTTINRTGVGAGDFVNQAAITVAGASVPVRYLVYQNKVKEVFFYTSGSVTIGNYNLISTFDQDQGVVAYNDIDLEAAPEFAIGKQILQSLDLP